MPLVESMPRGAPVRELGLWAGVCALLLGSGCSRNDRASRDGERANNAEVRNEAAAGASGAFNASLPHTGGVTGYVGSQACQSCHEDQFESWHRSYHRTMTQIATADTVRADFHNVTLTNDGVRFALSRKGDELRVRMERAAPAAPGEVSPEPVDVRVGLVTGSHHMQVFWLPGGQGNAQIGFPFTWLIPEKRWVPRNSTFVRPPDLVHRSEVWNVVCSRCHATGTEPRVDNATRTMDSRAAELGIACEACHGPGERHTQSRLAERGTSTSPGAEILRSEIVHPRKIDPVRASQICGFCHSMKWFDRSEAWRERGFRYRPGDDLEQTTPIIRPAQVERIPGLADFLGRNPDLLRDFFWPDGMIRVSGREYNGLLESPCYKGGKFSCLSCHSLHESNPDDQLARNRTDNRACTQCHDRFRADADLTAHTHHRAGSSGSQCYNCHMPHTTYGVLKAIRSHQISSPKIADQLAAGRPNACNLCHLDKTLSWTADQLARWYQQPLPDVSREQTEVADAVRLALAGDAGQRALLAWHFSWGPALEVSGKSWIPPILAQLLDDPYAAVRCVAERSLRQLAGGLLPPAYDYTLSPDSRPSVQTLILENWSREMSASNPALPPQTLAHPNDLRTMQEALQRLARQRDESPVRLRE